MVNSEIRNPTGGLNWQNETPQSVLQIPRREIEEVLWSLLRMLDKQTVGEEKKIRREEIWQKAGIAGK